MMGGGGSDLFGKGASSDNGGTRRDSIVNIIRNLPKDPDKLINKGWVDMTRPEAKKTGQVVLFDPKLNLEIRFDKGRSNSTGFKKMDHYHVHNPNATGNHDMYLDIDGNPVSRGSKKSHIIPKEE